MSRHRWHIYIAATWKRRSMQQSTPLLVDRCASRKYRRAEDADLNVHNMWVMQYLRRKGVELIHLAYNEPVFCSRLCHF